MSCDCMLQYCFSIQILCNKDDINLVCSNALFLAQKVICKTTVFCILYCILYAAAFYMQTW